MPESSTEQLSELIRSRRSVFPNMYNDRPIAEEVLAGILENANWAPTHRRTEPWRFHIFRGPARRRLADYLADHYRQNTPADQVSEVKLRKAMEKPLQADTVIAICMQRDPEERIPEWEEVAAVACAVQNMWLTCTAHGIGSYWSSPRAMLEAGEWLGLPEGQRCLGVFYMGHYDPAPLQGRREPVSDKIKWH